MLSTIPINNFQEQPTHNQLLHKKEELEFHSQVEMHRNMQHYQLKPFQMGSYSISLNPSHEVNLLKHDNAAYRVCAGIFLLLDQVSPELHLHMFDD